MTTRSIKKSNQQFQKAIHQLPLGVTSNFRYWGDEESIYIDRASGCRIQDLDGNEYIDYFGGHGAHVLGHNHPAIAEAD
mgnify:CR=1 FL=1